MKLSHFAAAVKARKADQKGFTLIELIIVIAIIGILVAIAIPVYGAIQGSARTNTVKSAAQNALVAASAALADDDSTTKALAAANSVENTKVDIRLYGSTGDTLCVVASWKVAADGVANATTGPGTVCTGTETAATVG